MRPYQKAKKKADPRAHYEEKDEIRAKWREIREAKEEKAEKCLATLRGKDKEKKYYRSLRGTVLGKDGSKKVVSFRKKCRLFQEMEHNFSMLLCGHLWQRDPSTWKPKGRSALAQRDSLLRHLFVKYPIPKFLYEIFCEGSPPGKRLFFDAAQGGSLYKGARKGKYLIKTMTRKMCHLFLQNPPGTSMSLAVRSAQVLAYGGTRDLAEALCRIPFGDNLGHDEEFKAEVIQWICNQGMMSPTAVGPFIDYVQHRRGEDASFSMRGRTYAAIYRGMQEWYQELQSTRLAKGDYESSGFEGFFYEDKDQEGFFWVIEEILSAKELSKEGRLMRHCVLSYSRWVEKGRTSIWSLRYAGSRRVTIEVDNKTKRVVQARGRMNRTTTNEEHNIISRWARKNGLRLAYYR